VSVGVGVSVSFGSRCGLGCNMKLNQPPSPYPTTSHTHTFIHSLTHAHPQDSKRIVNLASMNEADFQVGLRQVEFEI
jgi:hypothetical protein